MEDEMIGFRFTSLTSILPLILEMENRILNSSFKIHNQPDSTPIHSNSEKWEYISWKEVTNFTFPHSQYSLTEKEWWTMIEWVHWDSQPEKWMIVVTFVYRSIKTYDLRLLHIHIPQLEPSCAQWNENEKMFNVLHQQKSWAYKKGVEIWKIGTRKDLKKTQSEAKIDPRAVKLDEIWNFIQ